MLSSNAAYDIEDWIFMYQYISMISIIKYTSILFFEDTFQYRSMLLESKSPCIGYYTIHNIQLINKPIPRKKSGTQKVYKFFDAH